jgi:hypothetical protein
MPIKHNRASSKSQALVETILDKIGGLSKPRRNFIRSIIVLFLSLRGRYTFKGMERYGSYCEKSYRLGFEQDFDFLTFNKELIRQSLSSNLILAFDPSYLPKSGKHTPHLGKFWSGCLGKAVKGIEIGGLGVVDVTNHTALSLESIQTPAPSELAQKGLSLVDHYAQIILNRKDQLESLSKYLAVDGYFSKQSFVDPIMKDTNLELICKLRKDANLKYLYLGPRKKGKGRPRKFAGKIKCDNIDKRRFKRVHQDQEVIIYQAVVWSVCLKRKINLAYTEFVDEGQPTNRYALIYSTDLELDGHSIYRFYKARFQIEFLFRDAKQFTGLSECQSRSEKKLHFHFNTALTAVGVAKAAHYLDQEKEDRKSFSMADIKTSYFNELMLNLFLSNFQIDPNLKKNKSICLKLLNYGKIAS